MSKPGARYRTLYTGREVRLRVRELADEIVRDAGQRPPRICIIAEGARRFGSTLRAALRERGLEAESVEVRVRRTRGQVLLPVELDGPPAAEFEGEDVLVVDDIADEGRTLNAVLSYIREGKPSRLMSAVLVDKRERRVEDIQIDYIGFEVVQGWVIGFGMDLDGEYRDLDEIAVLSPER